MAALQPHPGGGWPRASRTFLPRVPSRGGGGGGQPPAAPLRCLGKRRRNAGSSPGLATAGWCRPFVCEAGVRAASRSPPGWRGKARYPVNNNPKETEWRLVMAFRQLAHQTNTRARYRAFIKLKSSLLCIITNRLTRILVSLC